jgi:hypothetical protein
MMFLLDVNALLAMRYEHHVHYTRVDKWASRPLAEGAQDRVVFATCRSQSSAFCELEAGKMVRDAPVHDEWAHLMPGSHEGSRGILLR